MGDIPSHESSFNQPLSDTNNVPPAASSSVLQNTSFGGLATANNVPFRHQPYEIAHLENDPRQPFHSHYTSVSHNDASFPHRYPDNFAQTCIPPLKDALVAPNLLTDPRLQETQRNNYVALGILQSTPQQPQTTDMSQIQVPNPSDTLPVPGKKENGKVDNGKESDNTKKRNRSRRSATTQVLKPLKTDIGITNKNLNFPITPSGTASSDSGLVSSTTATTTAQEGGGGGPSNAKKAKVSRGDKELLSEEQKKVNHVLSEQRRRALIKEGFEKLEKLTPALSLAPVSAGPGNTGGGHSKSAILFSAAAYIEELQRTVNALKAQLEPKTF